MVPNWVDVVESRLRWYLRIVVDGGRKERRLFWIDSRTRHYQYLWTKMISQKLLTMLLQPRPSLRRVKLVVHQLYGIIPSSPHCGEYKNWPPQLAVACEGVGLVSCFGLSLLLVMKYTKNRHTLPIVTDDDGHDGWGRKKSVWMKHTHRRPLAAVNACAALGIGLRRLWDIQVRTWREVPMTMRSYYYI
jgi:hypothetical protein